MNAQETAPEKIRVLVVDDDRGVRDSYLDLLGASRRPATEGLAEIRARLFPQAVAEDSEDMLPSETFDVVACGSAEEAVSAVRKAHAAGKPFSVAFLDVRMPPGPDGAWAAEQIRRIDERLDIVIATAYSDVDPAQLAAKLNPAGNTFYLQKPFHPHEVRQLAATLGRKRLAEDEMRRLAHFAFYDGVTGLPNRELFKVHLRSAMELAGRHQRQLAILFIDLDNFKQVNDTLGPATGDLLLREVAHRLSQAVRACDGVCRNGAEMHGELARLGGDEFIVLLSEIAQPSDAAIVANRLMTDLNQPLSLSGHDLVITASIGIAVFPMDGADLDGLMKSADVAMYSAKREGRNLYHFYTAEMNEASLRRMTLEYHLRRALERDEFTLQYQPQIAVGTGEIRGVEALLRWTNPVLGAVAPLDFISAAEETGLIIDIGIWVLRTACAQAVRWREAGLPTMRMAVNVSARQFMQPLFAKQVSGILRETGQPPDLLELEITESVLMGNVERALRILQDIKALGVHLSIDDFGTGYSSLAYLQRFPVDRLKIDRSFIADVSADAEHGSIAYSIIVLAQNLGLQVTAEGVENAAQLAFLKALSCHEAQGYLFSVPLSSEEMTAYLRSRG